MTAPDKIAPAHLTATHSAPLSGTARVLRALQSGPKSAAYLYSLGVMTHSRVAELRRRGHVITCSRVPGEKGARAYVYVLEQPQERAA